MSPARLAGIFLFLLVTANLLLPLSQAQSIPSDPGLEMGFKPFGAFDGGDIDSVNLMNRGLNVHIPLVSPQPRTSKAPPL